MILGIGTRWSDFTTASRSLFAEDARFINLNVASVDAFKHAGLPLVGDARDGPGGAGAARWRVTPPIPTTPSGPAGSPPSGTPPSSRPTRSATARCPRRARCSASSTASPARATSSSARRARCPATCTSCGARATRRATTSSTATRRMGYEIAGGLGVKLAAPDRDVYVMVGDGSFLMMAQEIVTAVQEGVDLKDRARPEPRLRVDRRAVRVARVAALRHEVPHARGPRQGRRGPRRDRGARHDARRARGRAARRHRRHRRRRSRPTRSSPRPDSEAWWDVPVAEVSGLDSTRAARETYDENKQTQQQYLNPRERVTP